MRERQPVHFFAQRLSDTARGLAETPSPEAMAAVLMSFLHVVHGCREMIRQRPGAVLWRLASQYLEVAEGLQQSAAASDPSFRRLPALMAALPWVEDCINGIEQRCRLRPSLRARLRSFVPEAGREVQLRAAGTEDGEFCATALHIQNRLEARLRQVWLLGEFSRGEPTALDLYAGAHAGLFPALLPPVSGQDVADEMARLGERAAELALDDIAACFAQPEALAQFGLQHLMPPDPSQWSPRFPSDFTRLFGWRLARWYLYSFYHEPEPLELAATVLQLGRPHDYERTAAHALLEYRLAAGAASFDASLLGYYLDAMRALEFQFEQHFEGYLLRIFAGIRLKSPEGWCWYFDALRRLHQGQFPLPELEEFRAGCLGRRGLEHTSGLLQRLTAGGTVH